MDAPAAEEQLNEEFKEVSPRKEYYLDPEGGYADPEIGR